MVKPLADQMVDLSRKVSEFLSSPIPARKNGRRRRPKTNSEGGRNPFPQTPRLPSALSERRAERDAIKNCRIFGEKSSNFDQKVEQNKEKALSKRCTAPVRRQRGHLLTDERAQMNQQIHTGYMRTYSLA